MSRYVPRIALKNLSNLRVNLSVCNVRKGVKLILVILILSLQYALSILLIVSFINKSAN